MRIKDRHDGTVPYIEYVTTCHHLYSKMCECLQTCVMFLCLQATGLYFPTISCVLTLWRKCTNLSQSQLFRRPENARLRIINAIGCY